MFVCFEVGIDPRATTGPSPKRHSNGISFSGPFLYVRTDLYVVFLYPLGLLNKCWT